MCGLEAGRTIPAGISVVGFDDTPVTGFLTPSLTTPGPRGRDEVIRRLTMITGGYGVDG